MALDRVFADAQQRGDALAGGHEVGVRHAQTGPPGSIQRRRHQRLYRDGPIAVARRVAAGQIAALPCCRIAQFGFGGIGHLLCQRGTQRIRRHARRDVPHPGPADLCIHAGAKGHSQQDGPVTAGQVAVHILPLQKARFRKAFHIAFQPDGVGRCRRQDGHGTPL